MATSPDDIESPPTCNIFISYQWKSQPKVKKLYAELAEFELLNVFMDIYRIKVGHNLYASLATNIQQADLILACLSRDYVKSKNCEREIIYADAFNKTIMPLYIEKIPIQELGSIGFILVRERFCNLYKNENIFDCLKGSDELNDIIDGISSIISSKKLSVQLPLKRGNHQIIEEPSFDQAIIKFRNDTPLEEVFCQSREVQIENDQEENDDCVEKEQKRREVEKPKKKSGWGSKTPSKPAALPQKPQAAPPRPIFNFFQVHPIIKELKYLTTPQVLLEPLGDRFEFINSDVSRGGEVYFKPVGWIRYGLKVLKLYRDGQLTTGSKWLSKDGNPDEWSVVYHSFKTDPVKFGLYRKLFDKNKFSPNFRMSQNLSYVSEMDVNQHSESFNSACGMGIFCSARPEVAEEVTARFSLNGVKYKMLLQCRVNPRKVRIPRKNPELRIIPTMDYLRPYGILIKEV